MFPSPAVLPVGTAAQIQAVGCELDVAAMAMASTRLPFKCRRSDTKHTKSSVAPGMAQALTSLGMAVDLAHWAALHTGLIRISKQVLMKEDPVRSTPAWPRMHPHNEAWRPVGPPKRLSWAAKLSPRPCRESVGRSSAAQAGAHAGPTLATGSKAQEIAFPARWRTRPFSPTVHRPYPLPAGAARAAMQEFGNTFLTGVSSEAAASWHAKTRSEATLDASWLCCAPPAMTPPLHFAIMDGCSLTQQLPTLARGFAVHPSRAPPVATPPPLPAAAVLASLRLAQDSAEVAAVLCASAYCPPTAAVQSPFTFLPTVHLAEGVRAASIARLAALAYYPEALGMATGVPAVFQRPTTPAFRGAPSSGLSYTQRPSFLTASGSHDAGRQGPAFADTHKEAATSVEQAANPDEIRSAVVSLLQQQSAVTDPFRPMTPAQRMQPRMLNVLLRELLASARAGPGNGAIFWTEEDWHGKEAAWWADVDAAILAVVQHAQVWRTRPASLEDTRSLIGYAPLLCFSLCA